MVYFVLQELIYQEKYKKIKIKLKPEDARFANFV